MSWNLQQPITAELAANKANKDGTDFTNPATWRTGLDVVNTAESRRQGTMDLAAVNFDGATTATRVSAPCQAIGTGDFSMWVRFRVPVAQPSVGGQGVITTSGGSTGAGSRAFGIRLSLSTLNVTLRDASGVTAKNAGLSNFHTNFAGQVVDVVVTRSGSTLKLYINGADTAYSDTGSGSWSDTVTSTFLNVGVFDSTDLFSGRIYRSVVFNRALSAADVTELITTGVNPADQWGTQTAAYTSDFSAGTDSWGAVRGTVAGNIDGISGVDNTFRFTVDGTATITHYAFRSPFPGLLASKRYRIGFDYFITAANATINGLRLQQLTTAQNITPIQSVTGAWTSITPVEFVSTETRLDVLAYAGANSTFNGNGTDTFYLHSIVLTRIGAIVDLDFTVGTGYQAHDRSSNNLHGTLFNGVEFMVPRRMAVLYATTAASGNTKLLGTLAIPTNAVIEDVVVNSSGSSTVSVGKDSAETQIVNGASVVSGRQKLTIATPFSTTGNLWVASSAAVTLQFTIFYTIAA